MDKVDEEIVNICEVEDGQLQTISQVGYLFKERVFLDAAKEAPNQNIFGSAFDPIYIVWDMGKTHSNAVKWEMSDTKAGFAVLNLH